MGCAREDVRETSGGMIGGANSRCRRTYARDGELLRDSARHLLNRSSEITIDRGVQDDLTCSALHDLWWHVFFGRRTLPPRWRPGRGHPSFTGARRWRRGAQSRKVGPGDNCGKNLSTLLGACAQFTERGMGPEIAEESPTPVSCVRRAGSSGECSSGDRTTTSRETSGVRRATAAKRLLSFDEKSGTAERGRVHEPDDLRSSMERSPAPAGHGVTVRAIQQGTSPEWSSCEQLLGPVRQVEQGRAP
jgi:hypothetical protein